MIPMSQYYTHHRYPPPPAQPWRRRGSAWDHRRCAASARAIFLAVSVASCPFSCPRLSRNHPAQREAPLCSPLPAPCQVEIIVQLEGFKTCAKHVPPGPQTLPCSFSLCQRFARSYLAFRRFPPQDTKPSCAPFALCRCLARSKYCIQRVSKPAQSTFHQGPKPFRAAPCQRVTSSNIAFRAFFALCLQPCQVEILHLDGFKTCAKHVPPGPQTLPCSFSPLPALCQVEYCISTVSTPAPGTFHWDTKPSCAPFALCPCLARSKFCIQSVSKPARSTFHQGPKPLRATLAPLASALPSPFALALPGRNTAFRGFQNLREVQNLREARSTRAPKPSMQLQPFASALPGLGHETLLCTFRPLPLPCQVEILHLEDFKTCAKHVPPGHPQNHQLQPLASALPSPFALPCQVAILHLERVSKPARSTFHQGPKTLRAALILCQRFAKSNIAFRRVSTPAPGTSLGQETLLCTFRTLPLPCQVEILHLEGFKTCAKHVPPTPNPSVQLQPLASVAIALLPLFCKVEILHLERVSKPARSTFHQGPKTINFSPLPAPLPPCQRFAIALSPCLARSKYCIQRVSKPARSTFHQGTPKPSTLAPCQRFAIALPGRNTAFREGFKTCAKHVPPGPQNPPCSFSPVPALCQVEYCIQTGFHTCARHVSLGHETLLCTFRPLPLPCQVEILHLEGFKTCAKHVPPGPQNPPCSFSPLPALCHRPLPLPCQVEILHVEGFKTCAKHVPPGPQNPPCSFSPLPALCQIEYCILNGFHTCAKARFTRTRNPPVHLSPFAQVKILHLEGFKTCAKHVPPGPQTLPCNFSPYQRFAIALSPCLATSKYCM